MKETHVKGSHPLSKKVLEFERDAKTRAARSRGIDIELLLEAKDEAALLFDHIGMTVLRGRVQDNILRASTASFKMLLEQLLVSIKAAEMDAVEGQPPGTDA